MDHCQGVSGHKGHHWAYRPCGSYAWSVNDNDPESIADAGNAAGGWTPPSHPDWVSPQVKEDDFFVGFFKDSEVVDPEIIKAIENEDYEVLGDDTMIDMPVTDEELDWVRNQLKDADNAEEDSEDI